MVEAGDNLHVRFPYARRTISILSSMIPEEHRHNKYGYGWDKSTTSWKFPLEYWETVEDAVMQVYPDLKLFVVDELPPVEIPNVEDVE